MPVFQYKALDAAGKTVQGLKEADSPKALRAVLKRDGIFLTEVLGAQAAKAQAAREVSVKRRDQRASCPLHHHIQVRA